MPVSKINIRVWRLLEGTAEGPLAVIVLAAVVIFVVWQLSG